MERAMSYVTIGTPSVKRAAIEYDVPWSTLHDWVSGMFFPGPVSGPPRYLDSDEEEEFVDFVLGCAEVGYPKTVKEVRAIVGTYVPGIEA